VVFADIPLHKLGEFLAANLSGAYAASQLGSRHYGTGMPKIMGCYSDSVIKPNIELSDNAFKITLPNINYYASMIDVNVSDRERKVVALLKDTESISRKDIEDALCISQATAILLLRDMQKKRLITRVGSGKSLRYTLD